MASDSKQPPIERMANVIAHEIRNPLAVINNSVYFIKMKVGESSDAKVQKHLRIVEEEVKRANDMIGQMLAYARPLEVNVQAVSAKELVDAVLLVKKAPAKVKVSAKVKDAKVKADREIAQGALGRLLDNAYDALGEGGGTVNVEVSALGGNVEFVVKDSGPGLTMEAKGRMFEPFFSTKPRGMGLGLVTAKKFVEKHGGSLEHVDGSTFKLRLPAA
ncbi:MAG: HAMP domain-containing histidine kinase [Elusimicrobia bacterium]|nr:HAMP domain-containing histidine kinase [Elusimicrobiota bacterium]